MEKMKESAAESATASSRDSASLLPPGAELKPGIRLGVVKFTFVVLFALEVLLNFEAGAMPSALDFITIDFHLTPIQQGLLAALPYSGTLLMSPFSAALLGRFNPKICVVTSLFLNLICTLAFAFSPPCTTADANSCTGTYILLSTKFFIGE